MSKAKEKPKTRKGQKLSEVEIFYIRGNSATKTLHQIALDLDRTLECVKKYYIPSVKEEIKVEVPAPKGSKIELAKVTNKGRVVGAVMTQGAAEMADETRKERRKMSQEIQTAVHKCKGENYNP